MPSVVTDPAPRGGHEQARPSISQPLQYTGSLEPYQKSDLTPVIGREYHGLQVADILKSEESERLIKDLAVTSMLFCIMLLTFMGVNATNEDSLTTRSRLPPGSRCHAAADGRVWTKTNSHSWMCMSIPTVHGYRIWSFVLIEQPESSALHVHPLTEEGSELGDQISVISSEKQKKGGGLTHQLSDTSRLASVGWHTDISFERVPSDYAMLKIHTLPETGGDTLWASGYEVYDRLSPHMAAFLETLTATHDASFFHDEARRLGNPLRKGVRGSPLNTGEDLKAAHPVVRTNRMLSPLILILILILIFFDLWTMTDCHSRHRMEIRLRQQGLHEAYQWSYQRRVRPFTAVSL